MKTFPFSMSESTGQSQEQEINDEFGLIMTIKLALLLRIILYVAQST